MDTRLTLPVLADGGAVTTGRRVRQDVWSDGRSVDRFFVEDNPNHETVKSRPPPQGGAEGRRSGSVQDKQLKSLILAQPERWRRG